MYITLIVATIAVMLTYFSRNRQNGLGLKLAFACIFIFLALRYDFGNDYMAYLDGYNETTANVKIFLTGESWEPGWRFLLVLFKPFGFFAMVGFTSFATCIVFYRFIRDYVPAGYQWLAIFLYVFDPYLFLVPASAMRQNVAIILFLVAIELLYKKRTILYLLIALAASTFHKSGIVLTLLVLFAFINIKINKIVAVVCLFIFVSLFVFSQQIYVFINSFVGLHFEKYAASYLYGSGGTLTTGIGFIYSLFLFGVVLYFAGVEFIRSEETTEESLSIQPVDEDDQYWLYAEYNELFPNVAARRILFKLAILTFMFTPLSMQLAMIGRINMYFTPIIIAVYPIILFTTKDRFFHLMLLGSLIPFTLFRFWIFFLSPTWHDKFWTYQTIFSAPQWF